MFYLHFIWFQARIVRRRRGQVDVWFITRLRLRTSVPPVPPLRLRLCPRPHVHQSTDRVVAAVVPLSTRALRAGRRNVCFKCLIETSNCALFLFLFDCFFLFLELRFKMFDFKVWFERKIFVSNERFQRKMFDPKQRSFFELFNLSLQCLISKIKCLFRILKSSCQSAPHTRTL